MSLLPPSAKESSMSICHTCGRANTVENHKCERCGTSLHMRKTDSVQRCLAYSVASIVAYIPANLWPIMNVDELGAISHKTILGGVVEFWGSGVYIVSIIIFTASVMIPGLKLLSLFSLCAVAKGWLKIDAKTATKLYYLTELVGRWSMLDVFVVAILVGLIQIGDLMSITAGPAAIAFALMVILTMLAAHSFDPRVIWDQVRKNENES